MRTSCGVYARISRDSEELGLGVARQLQDCERLAAKIGWTVAEQYIDNDVSATRSKVRPAYQRMMADAAASRIGGIVVWDVDRLSRTPRELEDIIDLAKSLQLQLASVGGDIDLATPQGQLTARIKGSVARHETDQQSRRLRRKYVERAQAGKPHVFPPYGYKLAIDTDDKGREIAKRHVIHDEQAAAIRTMAELVLTGRSLRSIATQLNADGTFTPHGHPWASQTVRRTILRPVYAGLKTHGGTVVAEGEWPPIIDRSTHEQIVALLSDPGRRTQRGSTRKHLLTGILRCGNCGEPMVLGSGRVNRATGIRQPPAYVCQSCFKVRRNQERVDEVVIGTLLRRLSMPDAVAAFMSPDLDARAATVGEMAGLEARLQSAAEQYAEGAITGQQLATVTRSIRGQLDGKRATLAAQTAQPDLADIAGPLAADRWAKAPLDVQRQIIELLMTVTIMPSGPGKPFDPDLIIIEWALAK
jgi:site-specific DNA recombinase